MNVVLQLEVEKGISTSEVGGYIKEALGGWGKGYEPEHPLAGGLEVCKIVINK